MQTPDIPETVLDIRRDALRRPQTTTRAGGVLAIQQEQVLSELTHVRALTKPLRARAKLTIQHEQMFMYAVKHGHLGTVEQLLSNRVVHANMLCQEARAQQRSVSDRDSTTILMLAAREGHADVVRLLLSYNADLLAKVLSLLALLVEKYKYWHRRRSCCSCFCWRASNDPLVLIA